MGRLEASMLSLLKAPVLRVPATWLLNLFRAKCFLVKVLCSRATAPLWLVLLVCSLGVLAMVLSSLIFLFALWGLVCESYMCE